MFVQSLQNFELSFKVQCVPLPNITGLSQHGNLQSMPASSLFPLSFQIQLRCTSKPKPKMLTHEGLLFSCQMLEWVLCGIAKDTPGKTTEKVVSVILQGWKIKPLVSAPFFITSLTHWYVSFLALSTGYTSLVLLLLAEAQISG